MVVPVSSVALMLTRRDISHNFYSQIQEIDLVCGQWEGYMHSSSGSRSIKQAGRIRLESYACPYKSDKVVLKESTNQYPSLYPARSATPGQT